LDPAGKAILNWLLEIAQSGGAGASPYPSEQNQLGRMSHGLWERKHCKLLAQVSLRYFTFFKMHLKFLVARTEEMEKERGDVGMEEGSGDPREGVTGEEVQAGREDTEEDSSARERSGVKGLVMEVETEREEGEGGDGLCMEVDSCEVKEETGSSSTEHQLPLDERVAWVTAHWVELTLAGGQVKEICLSLLTTKTHQLPGISQEELTHAGCTLTLVLPSDNVWKVVSAAVYSKIHEKMK
jgi:hypothetical protein